MQTGVSPETASGSTPVAMPPTTPVTAQRIGVPREIYPGEKRVATVPEVVEKLIKLGFRVVVQSGAGDPANFADDTYRAAGAEVVEGAAALWAAYHPDDSAAQIKEAILSRSIPTPSLRGKMVTGGRLDVSTF